MKTASYDAGSVCKPNHRRLRMIFRPVSADMREVEKCLTARLRTAKAPDVRQTVDQLLETPGKQIRPALVLLSACAAATPNKHRDAAVPVKLATAVELIHMASLVHDDLIDGATVRHHNPTVNSTCGEQVAVALGDYLCAHAFRLIADCGVPRFFALLGSGLCAMCEGEMLQVMRRGDLDLSEPHCLDIIEKKTASLFAACCEVGAVAAGGRTATCRALAAFGFHLGVAFQILDDCRDLLSDRSRLGKEPAQDWLAGDATLPLLHVAAHAPQYIPGRMPQGTAVNRGQTLAQVRKAFFSSNGERVIRELAQSQLDAAQEQLAVIRPSEFKRSLEELAAYITASVSDILAR